MNDIRLEVDHQNRPLNHLGLPVLSAASKQRFFGWVLAGSALMYAGAKRIPPVIGQGRLVTTHGFRSETRSSNQVREEILHADYSASMLSAPRAPHEFLVRVNDLINQINRAASIERQKIQRLKDSEPSTTRSLPDERQSFRFPAEAASWDLTQSIKKFLPEFLPEYLALRNAKVRRRKVLLKHLPNFLAKHGVLVTPSIDHIALRKDAWYANNFKYTSAAYIHSSKPITRTIWGESVPLIEGEFESTDFHSVGNARCGLSYWSPHFTRIRNVIGFNTRELKEGTALDYQPVPREYLLERQHSPDNMRAEHFDSLVEKYGQGVKKNPPTTEELKEMYRIHAAGHWYYERRSAAGEDVRLPVSFEMDHRESDERIELLRGRAEAFAILTEIVHGPRPDVSIFRYLRSGSNYRQSMFSGAEGFDHFARECFRYLEERIAYETKYKPSSDVHLNPGYQTSDVELDLEAFDRLGDIIKDTTKREKLKDRCLSDIEPDVEARFPQRPTPEPDAVPGALGIVGLGILIAAWPGKPARAKEKKKSGK